jgi:hypothetical protein
MNETGIGSYLEKVASCDLKRRKLFRIDLGSAPAAEDPNNRQEHAEVSGSRCDNEKRARRSALNGGGRDVHEGPQRERRECAI